MCYSAQVIADYRKFKRQHGAIMDLHEWYRLFHRRGEEIMAVKIPKGVELAFADAVEGQEAEIRALIDQFNATEATRVQQEMFLQRARLVEAERKLATKPTKKAAEDQRIATDKISKAIARLDDLRRTDLKDRDERIYPQVYAPVMVWEDGRRVIKPMRYQCRMEGKPADWDRRYPGTYNARRDNLEGFWKDSFGYRHGVIEISAFFENVNRHRAEGRELAPGEDVENLVLEFKPQGMDTMLVACLWSHWKGRDGEPDLLSFALITDEPPPEVQAAGHDRCPIPIKPENLDAWLNPDPKNLRALYEILDDRPRPYYEHRLAA